MSIVGGLLMYSTIISFGRKIYDDVEESVGSMRSKDARGDGVSGSPRIHREEVRKVAAQ